MGNFFADDNVAVPVVDRLIHHSHIFMLGGESYRLKQKFGTWNNRTLGWVNFNGQYWINFIGH